MADTVLVLDNGSGSIKAGYAGANFPSAVVQSVVGRPLLRSTSQASGAVIGADPNAKDDAPKLKDVMLGDETTGFRHLLDITMPVKKGVITNKDDLMMLWDFTLHNKMDIKDTSQCRLTLSETPGISRSVRKDIIEMLFERYNFKAIQSIPQGLLTLYSNGILTGLAVDCGDSVTHCTPVYDGIGFSYANRRMEVGGRDISEYLVRLMQRRGYHFSTSADLETMRCVKEMFCYAAVDVKKEMKLAAETTVLDKKFTLPDNTTCTIGAERFEATEGLFAPGRVGVEYDGGMGGLIFSAINAVPMDVRRPLYENIILAGGSTMFPGLPSRLERDILAAFTAKNCGGDASRAKRFRCQIHDAPRRKHMVFLGGATYAELTKGEDEYWLTKADFEEGGERAVTEKFGKFSQ